MFVLFALQVVLPVNPKMHLDVTLDDIFEEKQEICENTASLEFCLAVRSTRATLGTLRTDNCDVHDNVAEMMDFGLEIKRRDHTRVQTGMVDFIALPFPFPSKPKIGHFTSLLCRDSKECTKKRDARAELLFCS